ncbi:methylisocitrate lyase [Pseudalkalibacillus decolorationis]|uniref:methylisocitrate lyase n=1 Tax=Pseudalkalibacillus decolorationis TaxID=163879 RepID=UPI002148B7E5|nr:methylisocitrate lyase [Pseudalkalibacillus decolorationis]
MSWIVGKEVSQEELSSQFRTLMTRKPILQLPGAHDGMSALLAKQIGFEAIYLSGAAYTASRGLPDLGIVSSDEVSHRARDLVRATNLPILVDIDTGYGGILNTARAAKEMVEAKVAAVQIEDQDLPKKCGHLNGKRLVPVQEMVEKIKVIKEVAPSLVVIARTDAAAVTGIDDTIARANYYLEAGADAIFPEALTTAEDFKKMKENCKAPLLANMTEFGQTPFFTDDEFEALGYSMVIYPVTSLRVAAKAVELVYAELLQIGTQKGHTEKMQTRRQLYETIHYFDYEKLDKENLASAKP